MRYSESQASDAWESLTNLPPEVAFTLVAEGEGEIWGALRVRAHASNDLSTGVLDAYIAVAGVRDNFYDSLPMAASHMGFLQLIAAEDAYTAPWMEDLGWTVVPPGFGLAWVNLDAGVLSYWDPVELEGTDRDHFLYLRLDGEKPTFFAYEQPSDDVDDPASALRLAIGHGLEHATEDPDFPQVNI